MRFNLMFLISLSVSSAFAADFYPDAQSKYVAERARYALSAQAIQAQTDQKIAELQVQIDQYAEDKDKCTSTSCQKRVEDNIALLKLEQTRTQEAGVASTVQLTRPFITKADEFAVVAFMNESLAILQTDSSISEVRHISKPFPMPDGFDACTSSGGRWSRLPSLMMSCREMTVEFKYQTRYYRVRIASGLLNRGYTHNGLDAAFNPMDAVAQKDALFSQARADFMKNVTTGFLVFGISSGRSNLDVSDSFYYWFSSDSIVGTTRLF